MAAGLGFKTFNTGDVLSAADVNGYLMQGVLVFADATARDAAITSPQEGQFAYTKDNNSLWYYSGSAWVASGATGDIEGVTAGVGISGGGTSGTVTVTNSMATAIDAKGDLVVGTGADTFSKLTVGANGTTLVADSAEATGLKWAAPATGGGLTLITPTSTANSGGTVSTSGGVVTATTVNSVSLNGVFSATYVNYLIVYNEFTSSTNSVTYMRLRASGTDNTTASSYLMGGTRVAFTGGAPAGYSDTATAWTINVNQGSTYLTGQSLFLASPNVAVNTTFTSLYIGRDNAGYTGGVHNQNSSYDGFTILPDTGTISGIFRVYGITN
jgi:hypothetical protein